MNSIVNVLKMPFCKHVWKVLEVEYLFGMPFEWTYGCEKCGMTSKLLNSKNKRWRFKQRSKGATFND